jgi:hypothetical protein
MEYVSDKVVIRHTVRRRLNKLQPYGNPRTVPQEINFQISFHAAKFPACRNLTDKLQPWNRVMSVPDPFS